ncbi:MAG: hypothetical protein JKY32_04485 [Rhizobiales bacterium]|nr:hypothetical protein [Hyphomicrobiales bacterium]
MLSVRTEIGIFLARFKSSFAHADNHKYRPAGGLNVDGHDKIPMAGLRALCADLGWSDYVGKNPFPDIVDAPGAPPEAGAFKKIH